MNILDNMQLQLFEYKNDVDRKTMLSFANHTLSDGGKMGKECSFLVWGKNKSDTSIFWEKETWDKIKPFYLVVGMNQSVYIENNFGIFHKERAGTKLKDSMKPGGILEGAIITDLIKLKKEFVVDALKQEEAKHKMKKLVNIEEYLKKEDDENGIWLEPRSDRVRIIWENSAKLRNQTLKMIREKQKVIKEIFGLSSLPTIVGSLGSTFTEKAMRDIGIESSAISHPSTRAHDQAAYSQQVRDLEQIVIIKDILNLKNFDNMFDIISTYDKKNFNFNLFNEVERKLTSIRSLKTRAENLRKEREMLLSTTGYANMPPGEDKEFIRKEMAANFRMESELKINAANEISDLTVKYNMSQNVTAEEIDEMILNLLRVKESFGVKIESNSLDYLIHKLLLE